MRSRTVRFHHEVNAREQVDEQVTRHARPIVLIVAPTEHTHRIKLSRFGAEPRKRSQSTLAGVASGGIEYCHAPCAELRSQIDSIMWTLPMAPLRTKLARLLVQDRTGQLAAHLENPAGFLRLDHHRAFFHAAHHGLLAVDVLAGAHRFAGDGGMPVVPALPESPHPTIAPRQNLATNRG